MCNLSLIFWPPELEASLFTDGRLPPNLGDHHYLIKQLTVAYYCNVCLWGKLFEYTCCRKYDLFNSNQVKWCTPVEVVKVTNQLFCKCTNREFDPIPEGTVLIFCKSMKRVDLFYILNICKPISIHKLKRTPFWGNLQTSIFGKCLVLFGGFVPDMEGEECDCLLTQ